MPRLQIFIKRENSDFACRLSFEKGESLLLLCQKAGIFINAPCNGKGSCGKCRVRFTKGAPLPVPAERKHLTPEELRLGIRLACMCTLTTDCEVVLPAEKETDVITGGFEIRWSVDEDKKTPLQSCFIAADIGTTTIVMEKRRLCDGERVAVYKAVNAQRKYGADVLTRMEAALSGEKERLSRLLKEQLAEGIKKLQGDGKQMQFMVIAANTTMVHLLMEYDVAGLSRAPFTPYTLDEIHTNIAGLETYVMPGISAFVGGDIVADLYAAEYLKNRQKAETQYELLIDLGTNAELVLFGSGRGICSAAAAGPAFDLGAGTGFFGSDMIAILAELLEKGVVDENGTLDDAHFDTGALIPAKEGGLTVSQKQIRSLQLAKAAVRCGIDVLTAKMGIGVEQIGKVYLSGGFGYYLDVSAAVKIGLLPLSLARKTIACGNMALLGAALYAGNKIMGKENALPVALTAINLAKEPAFTENYINYINLT